MIDDLVTMIEIRSKLLANRPSSADSTRAAEGQLPRECQDSRGAPPVVVWLVPVAAFLTEAPPPPRGENPREEGRDVRPRWGHSFTAGSSSSWSEWWPR